MNSKNLVKSILVSFAAFTLVLQPLLVVGQWKFDRAQAQTTSTSSPEDRYVDNNPIDSIEELNAVLQKKPPLKLAPQDINNIRDNRVDTRVISYLAYLVTPVEQGGAGIDYIKTQRILKNYDTSGTGRFDRETLAAIEEETSIVSAHNTGQAVDISEVGAVTCKVIKKRHFGGSSTSFQRPRPIKVAWQTRDGVARHPTPRGPSLFEVAGNMSAESILLMLNESGEMDDFSDYVKGLSLGDMFRYVGANILLKNYGVGDIVVDPLSSDVPDMLGALLIQQSIPNLPVGLPIAEGPQDIREAIARAYIEELMNLPHGSLRGSGWDSVLTSTGKRTLENSLGIPTLTLENKSLDELLKNDSVKASLKQFALADNSFGLLPGTVALINAKDERAYVWAGVNILADSLRLSGAQKAKLITAVKNSQNPDIDLETTGTDRSVPIDALKSILVPNNDNSRVLKDFGKTYLDSLLFKAIPNSSLGLSKEVIRQLGLSTSEVIYGELRSSIGQKKIASDSSTNSDKVKTNNYSLVAGAINSQFNLVGVGAVNSNDIDNLINSSGNLVVAKIGGNQIDKAVGWNFGTGLAVIEGQKTVEQGLQEAFGNSINNILGLERGSHITLEGDVNRNYGDAIVEQRLNIDVKGNGSATDINSADLYSAFGIRSSLNLVELRKNTSFWSSPTVTNALEYTDIRLGAPIGTSKKYLLGELANEQLSRSVAQNNLGAVTKDKLLDYLDLEDAFKLTNDELGFIVGTISNWDGTSFENKQKVISLGKKLMGRSLDSQAAFDKDTFLSIAQGETSEVAVNLLINQGIKQLASSFGVNIPGFSEGNISQFAKYLTDAYNGRTGGLNGQIEQQQLRNWISQTTKIPAEYQADINSFLVGDFRVGMESWSAAMMVDFANKYLPSENHLTYEEMRGSINLTNSSLIDKRAREIAEKEGGTIDNYKEQARRELMQEIRSDGKYKISDAFLIQAEIPIPLNFSKVMFSGTNQERSEMLTVSVFTYLDKELQKINPLYVPGTLSGIYDGTIDPLETNQLITNIVSNKEIQLGSFSTSFVASFYSFIKADDKTAFYSDSKHSSMWQYMENWFGSTLGIAGLEPGYAKSIYYASQNGWNFNASLSQNGQVVVPSMETLGVNILASRITHWADKTMNIPAGSAYQMYQAASSVVSASRAIAAAKAAGDASQLAQAQNNLSAAQAQLTVIVINIALNACEACQQFFASVDKVLAAPPGFTNALVAGAVASAFGLGPAGLIAAAAIYLFGVYKVEYKCPLPPPGDWYAHTQFDNPQDAIDPFASDYYQSKDQLIKDQPAPGENPFDWDDGVPFVKGNNPELWMAWSRYFTGKLLDATMTYGAIQESGGKPLQVITYRQASVEYFAPRSLEAFGPAEANNSKLGLGFTQNSTKTTDWVHVSYGGYF